MLTNAYVDTAACLPYADFATCQGNLTEYANLAVQIGVLAFHAAAKLLLFDGMSPNAGAKVTQLAGYGENQWDIVLVSYFLQIVCSTLDIRNYYWHGSFVSYTSVYF